MSSSIVNSPAEIQKCLAEAELFATAFHKLGEAIAHRRRDPQPDSYDDLCDLESLYAELQTGINLAKEKTHGETKS